MLRAAEFQVCLWPERTPGSLKPPAPSFLDPYEEVPFAVFPFCVALPGLGLCSQVTSVHCPPWAGFPRTRWHPVHWYLHMCGSPFTAVQAPHSYSSVGHTAGAPDLLKK